jgi:thymidine kinase
MSVSPVAYSKVKPSAKTGSLRLTVGPPKSGKSSAVIGNYLHYAGLDHYNPVILIPSFSYRSDDLAYQRLLSGQSPVNLIKVGDQHPKDLLDDYNPVIIDEGQFYPNLTASVWELMNLGKTVFVYAIDGDIHQKPMFNIGELVVIASEVKKLTGECEVCRIQGLERASTCAILSPDQAQDDQPKSQDGVFVKIGRGYLSVCFEHTQATSLNNESVSEQPISRPVPEQPISRPVPEQSISRPVPEQSISRPVPEQPISREKIHEFMINYHELKFCTYAKMFDSCINRDMNSSRAYLILMTGSLGELKACNISLNPNWTGDAKWETFIDELHVRNEVWITQASRQY